MRIYRKRYELSEFFPADKGETWVVRQGNFVAEKWTVISARRGYMVVEIVEYFGKNDAPRRVV